MESNNGSGETAALGNLLKELPVILLLMAPVVAGVVQAWMDGAASVAVCAGIFLAAASCYRPVPPEKLAAGILSAALGSPFAERVVHFLPSESKVLGAACAIRRRRSSSRSGAR